uniref:DUF6923 family protein n=1 Tax=Leptobacterium meishanense TaxID=3128904 RepID=UPI0030EDAA14
MKIFFSKIKYIAIVLYCLTAYKIHAQTPFVCDGQAYISVDPSTRLLEVERLIPGGSVYTRVNPAGNAGGWQYNATGFNIEDGFIYGVSTAPTPGRLLRIDANETVTNLGALTLDVNTPFLNLGDMDFDGNLYARINVETGAPPNTYSRKLYKIDVSTSGPIVVEKLTMSAGYNFVDFAFNPVDGKLYGVERGGNNLVVIDLPNEAGGNVPVTRKTIQGINLGTGDYGATWFDSNGVFYAGQNSPGRVYSIRNVDTTPVADIQYNGPTTGNNDACACAGAPKPLKSVFPQNAVPGSTVTYTYTFSNLLKDVMTLDVSDDLRSVNDFIDTGDDESATPVDGVFLPGTLNIMGATETIPASFTNGNKTLFIDNLSIPAGNTVTITVDVQLPAIPESYYNQATLTDIQSSFTAIDFLAPLQVLNSDDPNQDFDKEPTIVNISNLDADLSITKTINNPNAGAGANVTFTITVDNNGPDDATGVEVDDLLPDGYTYVSSTPSIGTYNQFTGIWNIGNVAVADPPRTLTITATVNPTGDYLNVATVTGNQPDSDLTNNTDSAGTMLADLVMNKVVDKGTPNVGDNVVFTLTVTNNGPS